MSDPAGRLKIQIQRLTAGTRCTIRSSRPVTASSIFEGRSSAEVATLLPLLYSICAKAQSYACVGALESALGITPAPNAERRRELTLTLETLREHLWRILLDWPRLCSGDPRREALSGLVAQIGALFRLADPSGALFKPGGDTADVDASAWLQGCDAVESLVVEEVLGRPVEAWLEAVVDRDGLESWAKTTATEPARLLRSVMQAKESALGGCNVTALTHLEHAALAARLTGEDAATFIAEPRWKEEVRETGPLSRCEESMLIRALAESYGKGLLTRLTAQILEVAQLTVLLRQPGDTTRADSGSSSSPEPGLGLAEVEAARGRLVHLARLADDRVQDYRILAPTEWNFHPEGPVAMAIAGLPGCEDATLRRRAELLIMAIDPCVAYDLELVPSSQAACVTG